MATDTSLYTDWSHELARQATITVETGAAEADYGPDLLIDDNPAHVFKATGTTVALEFAFAEKTPIDLLALIHATLEASDDVRLQGDDDADWDAPTFNQVITPSGWVGAGVTRWPVNTWVQPLASAGYDALGFKNYRLAFGIETPLVQALQLGQVWMHAAVQELLLDRNADEVRQKPNIDNQTSFLVSTIYTRGTTRWRSAFTLSALFDTEDERAALQTHWSDVDGGNRPWLFVPDQDQPECYLVRWATTEEQITRVVRGVSNRLGGVTEVGRGLRPGV